MATTDLTDLLARLQKLGHPIECYRCGRATQLRASVLVTDPTWSCQAYQDRDGREAVDVRCPLCWPIEIDLFRPHPDKPGMLQHAGRRTYQEVRDELNSRLLAVGLTPDEYGMEVGVAARYGPGVNTPIPPARWIACFPVTGTSEGHYIHVAAIMPQDDGTVLYEDLFLGKTFQGMDRAAAIATACAKVLA